MNFIEPQILDYCINHSTRPSDLARELFDYTQKNIHGSQMLIGEMEASVLGMLIKIKNVKTILEFGTYTGYSALAMAEQLPDDGSITTLDINNETVKVAQSFWNRSPHGKKITSIIKPGLDALKEINDTFDLIFIDADKNNYSNYLKWAVDHLSVHGIIVTDNTLWSGKVLNPGVDKQTDSIREHNELASKLQNFHKTLLPIRDGMFVLVKL